MTEDITNIQTLKQCGFSENEIRAWRNTEGKQGCLSYLIRILKLQRHKLLEQIHCQEKLLTQLDAMIHEKEELR